MAYAIEFVPVIKSDDMKQPIFLKHYQKVDGVTFFKVSKVDPVIIRMFAGYNTKFQRPLSMTDIIEQITSLRNAGYNSALLGDVQSEGKEDLGLDEPEAKPSRRQRVANKCALPSMITVEAPTIEGIEGRSMKVLLSTPGQCLWVEFSSSNINYFANAVAAQLAAGHIKRAHPIKSIKEEDRVASDVRGVSYSYARKQVLVKGVSDEGQPFKKYFKVGDSIEATMAEASTWLETIGSNTGVEAVPITEN